MMPSRWDMSLSAPEVQLSDDLLDKIDEIVSPRQNVNSADAGWSNPALEPAARRR